MAKNGLFLISIGLLVFMLSGNATTGVYDLLSMITAVFLIAAGSGLMFWDKRLKKKKEDKSD